MIGIEPAGDAADDAAATEPIRFSEVSQICREFNMSPHDLRAMRFSDFVNMVVGFNRGSERQAEHLTEDEFMDILNRYEPEVEN